MENPVIILGAGYIGRQAKLIFEENGQVVYGFLDEDKTLHGKVIDDATILGGTDDEAFLKLIGKKCEAFVATDDNRLRKNIVRVLNDVRHVQAVNAIHKSAAIPESVSIGHGNLFDMGVMIGSGARIENHGLFLAGVRIGPEAVIGNFVQIGMGSNINAGVTIEDEAFIGSGVTIVSGVTIGKGARVGAGSVVISSVAANQTVFGNPAEPVKS